MLPCVFQTKSITHSIPFRSLIPFQTDHLFQSQVTKADCSAAAAICTKDGRKLSETVSATVRGPAVLSVADARADEGADAAVEFAVTLSRAAFGTVTVDYATRDGTAKAVEDYTRTRGTLSFAAGELEKTVSEPILDEGEETFMQKLMNPRGAAIANDDPLQKMWLSRLGRTVADHVTAAVSDRLANPLMGAQVTVAGQGVDLARAKDEAWAGETLVSLARAFGAAQELEPVDDGWPGVGAGGGESPALGGASQRSVSGRELLLGSTFHLAREGDGGGPGLAAWGRVTVDGFDGEAPPALVPGSLDGLRLRDNRVTGRTTPTQRARRRRTWRIGQAGTPADRRPASY